MGKIVKYCTTCEESFSEKFSFCPNCAQELTAFEMKRIDPIVPKVPIEAAVAPPTPEIIDDTPRSPIFPPMEEVSNLGGESGDDFIELDLDDEITDTGFEIAETAMLVADDDDEDIMVEQFASAGLYEDTFDSIDLSEENLRDEGEKRPSHSAPDEAETLAGGAVTARSIPKYHIEEDTGDKKSERRKLTDNVKLAPVRDDGYAVTVVPEGDRSFRRGVLLGSCALVLVTLFGAFLYSIFNHPYFVASIGDDNFLVAPVEVAPEETKVEEKVKKDGKDGGGGGGGGTERETPPSKGQLPSQTREKIPPPMLVERMNNPSLVVVNKTQGDIQRTRTDRVGLPDGVVGSLSGGRGKGGGLGTGTGTGFGSGRGTGEGSGIGSGSGSGIGDGNGDGRGSGSGPDRARTVPTPAPSRPAGGVTADVKILSKPRASYTDSARQNNVQGTVILRITFQANGSIGSISPVKTLPYGLTEQAIAAARNIRFTPATRNGQPYPVSKQVQFSFTIY